ncbi:MAG: Hsp70 family protein [Acetobacteraceae bacterium]|nr:Hsp70 family protein [Acetobacteraceae bacterium]
MRYGTAMTAPVIGVDFGTTNSVAATLMPDGTVTAARYTLGAETFEVFRSVLCFWPEETRARKLLHHAAGPAAIAAYVDDPLDSRLILSMKTYLAQRSFTQTQLFGRPYTLERLIGLFLRAFFATAGFAFDAARVVAGRPVRFAGEFADHEFGEQRLRAAFAEAGLRDIDVAFEPEAAGYRFARRLQAPATVLVGDFGGGTSDFSILRFEPGSARPVQAVAQGGVGIAGDVFDYRIIDHVIAPRLGKGDTYRVMGGADLPVPPEYFASFARWHRLSLMRNPRTMREIGEVARNARHPERLRHLLALIGDERGYALYQAVSAAKVALSRETGTRLAFRHGDFVVDEVVTRAAFERWIEGDVDRLGETVDRVMHEAALGDGEIDHVFLTGGTSFVPAVRRLFTDRFGEARMAAGGEFVSVAEGLALIGRDRRG